MKIKKRIGMNQKTWVPLMSKQKLIRMYIKRKKTIKEISNLYKVSGKSISNHMKKYKISSRGRGNRRCTIRGYKINKQGYKMIYLPSHPRSWENSGYVAEHIFIMEKKIGRYLKYYGLNDLRNEEVHHKDINKLNNNLRNLQLITRKKHSELHLLNRDEYGKFLGPLSKMPPKRCFKCGCIIGKNKHICMSRKIKNRYKCCTCEQLLKKKDFFKDRTKKYGIDSECIICCHKNRGKRR
jgi:hypothetical protein